MKRNQKSETILLLGIILLLLSAAACATATATPEAVEVDTDDIVSRAVATVRAQLPTPVADVPVITNSEVPAASLDLQKTLIDTYRKVNLSVVHIFVNSDAINIPLGTGSGFVLDEQGHIITNNHVVEAGDSFEVAFAEGSRRTASLVGTDVDSDLAVIKVDSVPSGVSPVPLSNSSELEVGQFVIAIGNPFGETGSMSVGIISGLGRTLDSQRAVEGGGRYSLPQVIQTDAAINPGNSGGPLLNLNGEVIGVNSAILTRVGTNSGVGFSIPVNAVKRVAPALIANGKYTYPFMGISMAGPFDLETQNEYGLPSSNGVYVTSVQPDTPAEAAGLVGSIEPGGDFITAIDDHPVRDSSELISYLVFETEVGQIIELTVIRDDEEIIVPLELGARP